MTVLAGLLIKELTVWGELDRGLIGALRAGSIPLR
ncbi:hypothetical protein Dalu01_02784 [Deinococcus aluminii]|uniref:Transposase n=1 Tax=Deinococcus aluminii TaxID=1656885 RepID=A0ABP9XG87_9DEIO